MKIDFPFGDNESHSYLPVSHIYSIEEVLDPFNYKEIISGERYIEEIYEEFFPEYMGKQRDLNLTELGYTPSTIKPLGIETPSVGAVWETEDDYVLDRFGKAQLSIANQGNKIWNDFLVQIEVLPVEAIEITNYLRLYNIATPGNKNFPENIGFIINGFKEYTEEEWGTVWKVSPTVRGSEYYKKTLDLVMSIRNKLITRKEPLDTMSIYDFYYEVLMNSIFDGSYDLALDPIELIEDSEILLLLIMGLESGKHLYSTESFVSNSTRGIANASFYIHLNCLKNILFADQTLVKQLQGEPRHINKDNREFASEFTVRNLMHRLKEKGILELIDDRVKKDPVSADLIKSFTVEEIAIIFKNLCIGYAGTEDDRDLYFKVVKAYQFYLILMDRIDEINWVDSNDLLTEIQMCSNCIDLYYVLSVIFYIQLVKRESQIEVENIQKLDKLFKNYYSIVTHLIY